MIGRQVPARIDDDRREAVAGVAAESLQKGEARGVRQRQVQHHAVEGLGLELLQTLCGGADADRFDVAGTQQAADCVALDQIVLHDQDAPDGAGQLFFQVAQDLGEVLALHRLDQIADGAQRKRGLAVVLARDDVNGDVAGVVVALQFVQNRQTGLVGQADVQNDGAGAMAFGQFQGFFSCPGDNALEAEFARQVAHDGGEPAVVFYHEQQPPVSTQVVPVVFDAGG